MQPPRPTSDNGSYHPAGKLAAWLEENFARINTRLNDLDERVGESEATLIELLGLMAETHNKRSRKLAGQPVPLPPPKE
jgi:hypothetical protein